MAREMSIFCDESGTHTCDYFGWGSIWCPTGKVEALEREVGRICKKHRCRRELKWSATSQSKVRRAVVRWFFRTPWVCFQSLLVRKDTMKIFGRRRSHQLAFRKLLCTMLTTCMDRFDRLPGGPRKFTAVVDETGGTTRSLTTREFRILTAAARKRVGSKRAVVDGFRRVDSRKTRGVQLADLFIGAIRAAWEGKPRRAKKKLCRTVARSLGWPNLRGTTRPNLKFNVWLHHDSFDDSPQLTSRRLRLRHPEGDPQRIFERLGRN